MGIVVALDAANTELGRTVVGGDSRGAQARARAMTRWHFGTGALGCYVSVAASPPRVCER